MQEIKEVTKKNYQKILREIDVAQFPSIFQDQYLKNIREKLLRKEKLLYSEEQISFHRLKMYIDDYKKQVNRYYVQQMNFSKFSHRPPLFFQEDGIKFLLLNDRCILADDTGIGKSIQAVIAALCLEEKYKILIVTTNSLKYNFQHEISFYSDSYKVIEKEWESGYKFTIVHYEALKKWLKEIEDEKFDCIIGDECHVVINKSNRSQNFITISEYKTIKKIWLLTGTPITNRPIDYFSLLKLIKHPLSKNWMNFVTTYCNGYKNYFGKWIVDGSSNEKELHDKTKDIILRRLKKDYIKDLPNKDRQPIFLKMNNWKGYNQCIKDYKNKKFEEVETTFGGTMQELFEEIVDSTKMTKLILWRQFCALEKVRDGSLIELITTKLEEENKIVVFTNFTSVIDAVYNYFGETVARYVDGKILDSKKRLEIIEEFNNTLSLKILILNLQVGSIGYNIQSANIAIINDMFWAPGTMLQAEDRLWRIGQLQEVTILYPIYKDTVEEIVYDIINKKMKIISTIIEGKKESYFDNDETNETKQNILNEIFEQIDKLML